MVLVMYKICLALSMCAFDYKERLNEIFELHSNNNSDLWMVNRLVHDGIKTVALSVHDFAKYTNMSQK